MRDAEGTARRGRATWAHDDNNKCCLLPPSLSPSLSFYRLWRCVPCRRFLWSVASFVHLNTSRLDAEWSERRRTERDGANTPAGGTTRGKGAEGERGKNGGERLRERDDFNNERGRGKWLECPGRISSTKRDLREQSEIFVIANESSFSPPGFRGFRTFLLVLRIFPRAPVTLCRSSVPTIVGPLKSASSMITPRD